MLNRELWEQTRQGFMYMGLCIGLAYPLGFLADNWFLKIVLLLVFQSKQVVVKNKYVASESESDTHSSGCYLLSELTYQDSFLLCNHLFKWLVHKSLPKGTRGK